MIMNDFDDEQTMEEEEALESQEDNDDEISALNEDCLLYTSPSPRDGLLSRMPSSA